MQTITKTTQTNVTHVKVGYNGEYRRFPLETLSFSYLEQLLRSLFEFEATTAFKILFLDDEKDWVLISTDEELAYASSLVAPTLRLTVKLPVQEATVQVKIPGPVIENISKAEARKAHNISIISSRLEELQEKIRADNISAGKSRGVQEKITRLQQKLDNLNNNQSSPVEAEEPKYGRQFFEGRGGRCAGRGRGCANGNVGRGRWCHAGESDNPENQLLFSKVQECKMELRAARQAKNEQEIQAKWDALQQAKSQWREASGKGPNTKPRCALPEWEEVKQKKAAKDVCFTNLRTAKAAGNQENIEACHLALSQAKEDLEVAKVALRAAKQGARTQSH